MSAEPTPEQKMEAVKSMLKQQLNGLYMPIVQFVKQLPINDDLRKFAIMNLDQGVMWTDQGIKALSFEVTKPPLGEVSNEESSQESSEKSCEKSSEESSCEKENEVAPSEPAAPAAE